MKHLIFATLCIAFAASAIEKESNIHWLQQRINKCKEKDRDSCRFLYTYIIKFYPTLCGGQGLRMVNTFGPGTTYTSEKQEKVCNIINNALVDEQLVDDLYAL